jgi:hypothetical protein
MTKCTDSQRWTTTPGANAPEEEVARYLAHLEECAFHAALEQRETAQLSAAVAFGGSTETATQLLTNGSVEATAMLDGLDRLGTIRRNAFVRTLSLRVDGIERARLDLLKERSLTLDVREGALIGIWQPDQSGEAEELYLTSYILHAGVAAPGAKRQSSTVLEGGQRISFTVEPGVESIYRLTIAYAETRWLRALRLSLARLGHRLSYDMRERRLFPVLKLTAAILVLLAVLGLPLYLLLRASRSNPVTEQAEAPAPVAVPPVVEPSALPSPSASPSPVYGAVPANQRRDKAARPGMQRPMSLAGVRRVYVATGEGAYLQRLRAAVIAELQESGRFTVVAREQEADAILLSELTRGAGVRVQLVDRSGRALWFTTQATSGEGMDDAGQAAARIVREISDKANARPSRSAVPGR